MQRRSGGIYGVLAAGAAAAVLMMGCSRPEQSTAAAPPGAGVGADVSASAGAGAPMTKTGRPTAEGVRADIAKVNADPNLSEAQKKIMLNQMNRAQAMQQQSQATGR